MAVYYNKDITYLVGSEEVAQFAKSATLSGECVPLDTTPLSTTGWVTGTSVGLATIRFVLVVECGPLNADGFADESARRRLDDFLSVGTGNAASIIDAVMSDKTLGGVADTCHIPRAEVDDATATARLPLEVHVRKVGANV